MPSVIRAARARLSRAPRTYGGWGDEDRRQGLLLMLSSRYRACRTYAAAFTASGRTDLLFRVEAPRRSADVRLALIAVCA